MENLQKFFKNKKVLITGHTGFKGAWLSQILVNWGAKVSGLALKPVTGPNLFRALKLENKINSYFVDIRNYQKVKNVISKVKPEIIFHLAAQALVRESYDQPLYTFETNIIGTANILEAIKEVTGIKAGVIITTDKVYKNLETGRSFSEGDPLGGYDPYSASKAGAPTFWKRLKR
jgi:CDP-glucose 4,6-dehydratase